MRAEVADHLRQPAGVLSADEIERRHLAAEERLAREVDEVVSVLKPVVRGYEGPPVKALQPVTVVRGEATPLDDGSVKKSRYERRLRLIYGSVSRNPFRRFMAMRSLRRQRRVLFPEDYRQTP